jgi:hypothetical protein
LHLSDATLRNLKATGQQYAVYDDTLAGFSVRVSQAGTRTFSLVYGSPRKRITLGRYPLITLSQARDKARKLLAHRMLHGDAPPDLTFDDALTLFLKVHCAEHNRLSTRVQTQRLLRRHFLPKLGGRTLKDIGTDDILRITDRMLKTPSEANHAFTAARTMFKWATRRRYIPHSPMEGLQMPAREQPRSRVLHNRPRYGLPSPTGRISAFTGRSSNSSFSPANDGDSSSASGRNLSAKTRSIGLPVA